MIRQLGLLTFFVTFTSIERLWDSLIKTLHTLHASRFKIKDLQSIHITKLIQIDHVTCVRYYDHRISCFCKFIMKDHYIYTYIYSSLNSKIVGANMTMDVYG
jgi:hypothetical protein